MTGLNRNRIFNHEATRINTNFFTAKNAKSAKKLVTAEYAKYANRARG